MPVRDPITSHITMTKPNNMSDLEREVSQGDLEHKPNGATSQGIKKHNGTREWIRRDHDTFDARVNLKDPN